MAKIMQTMSESSTGGPATNSNSNSNSNYAISVSNIVLVLIQSKAERSNIAVIQLRMLPIIFWHINFWHANYIKPLAKYSVNEMDMIGKYAENSLFTSFGPICLQMNSSSPNNRTLNYFSTITDNRNTNINNNKTILFLSIYIRDPFVDE